MKSIVIKFGVLLLVFLSMNACKKEDCDYNRIQYFYQPVTITWEEINEQIGTEPARAIKNPGKIYLLGDILFINEINEGVHVIDNADPSNPINQYFINIPGSMDIAAIGNVLYADNYSDLISLDISDFADVQLIERVPNVFYYGSDGMYFQRNEDGVAVDWIEIDTVIQLDCDIQYFSEPFFDGGVQFESSNGDMMVGVSAPLSSNDAVGVAGSMARFSLYNSHLFVINGSELKVFERGVELAEAANQYISWGIETLFPYQNKLFIGGNRGMYIYDISNPILPQYISSYEHINSCDPVAVSSDYAYVTLRSGTECENFTNQLDIIDISDITTPTLLNTYDMFNPHGLGITNEDVLFLCDGDAGLKIYDVTDKNDIQMIQHYADIHAYDVIPFRDALFMIGQGGFYQYDYSDIDNIHLVSTIPVVQ
jgi:hypothetical protein